MGLLIVLFSFVDGLGEPPPLPQLLPLDLELELALSAAPEHLRTGARVLVLKRGGYVVYREGSNGVTCLVRRSGVTPRPFYNIIAPMCFDREGCETLLPAVLFQTELLERGLSNEAVLEAVEQGFADGRFKTPRHGVNYMLSAANLLPAAEQPGRVFQYVPHYMFHAPYATPTSIGQASEVNPFSAQPFVAPPGKPWTFIIVPLGQKERASVTAAQAELVKRALTYVELAR